MKEEVLTPNKESGRGGGEREEGGRGGKEGGG
jgi:hypothetical protein